MVITLRINKKALHLILCRLSDPPISDNPSSSSLCQTLQMGIQHFSGLFVLLCMGVGGALLTLAGEHTFYHLVVPRLRRSNTLQYWLHTSQVGEHMFGYACMLPLSHLAYSKEHFLQRCAKTVFYLNVSLWCSCTPAALS